MIITSLLDNDFYAFTMGQVIWQHQREAEVSYQFINRQHSSLTEYISVGELQRQLDKFSNLQLNADEIAYLRSLELFGENYLQALCSARLPKIVVEVGHGKLSVTAQGPWWVAVLLETPVLAIITELYQREMLRRDQVSLHQAEAVGMTKLERKIALLRANPGIQFAEFGSRRRFSLGWQRQVLAKLIGEIPHQLTGTSNVLLAREFGIKPIGTMAHQMDMGYAAQHVARGMEDPLIASQRQVRNDWLETYDGKLNVYLTDTFRTAYAFKHLTATEVRAWAGFRQDSGDPIQYGENLLQWLASHGLDPQQHFMLCSDGLNVEKMVEIHQHFAGRLTVKFGIGTNLVNDLVHLGLNAVWKLSHISGLPTVKLSDEPGKFTGTPAEIAKYLVLSNHPEKDTYLREHHLSTPLTPAA